MTKTEIARQTGHTVFLPNVRTAPVKPLSSKAGVKLRAIKWAGSNAKIGGWMKKGPWSGMPIFQLTLEERATCPRTCQRWNSCYGDNMFLATRHKANEALIRAVKADLKTLSAKYAQGYVVRLHVLGDFYSVEYVRFWQNMLALHAGLRIYGYTHRLPTDPIGKAVTALVLDNAGRVSILRSDSDDSRDPLPKAIVIATDATEPHPATAVICPNEMGKVATCGDCGLCMLGRVSVSFRDHSHAVAVAKSMAARGVQPKASRQLAVLENVRTVL